MDRLFNGANLGPFRIIHQIGEGGMAKVYKAYQPSMERYVALKVLPAHYAEDPQFIERFNREARTIARLEHQNILPVFDFGEQDGVTYLAMRFVEGGTLKELLTRGKLTLRDTLQIITQLCSALDYAHRQGVVHRDVKPSNVILDNEGAAYLSDFGIAKVLGEAAELTGTGAAIGTPAYMAPEQAMGEKVDGRTDIYALGILLYEMVVGRVPYHADTPMAILMAHLREPLPLPHERNASIPEAVEAVIIKALAKEPKDRFQTANEMAQALRQAVYASAPESVETTLLNLINEVRSTKKGPETVKETAPSLDSRTQAQIEQQYIDGLSAYWTGNWEKARTCFQAVVNSQPGYKDAASRLAEVEKQSRLADLFQKGSAAMEAAEWQKARDLLRQVSSLDSSYQDVENRLKQVERKLELAGAYAQADQLFQAEQWQAVIKVFEHIQHLEAGYADPKGLLSAAKSKLAELQRLEKVKAVYQRGLHALDEGHWKEAQKLFEQVKAMQAGYGESDKLLQRASAELAKSRAKERTKPQDRIPAPPALEKTIPAEAGKKPARRSKAWIFALIAVLVIASVGILAIVRPEIWKGQSTPTLAPAAGTPAAQEKASQPTTVNETTTEADTQAQAEGLDLPLRVRLTSSSDWANFSLFSIGSFAYRLEVPTGKIKEIFKLPRRVQINQEIGRSTIGHNISVLFDLELRGNPGEKQVTFTLEKGCLGIVQAEIYNMQTSIPILVADFHSDTCAGPVSYRFPVELFLSQDPPEIPRAETWPSVPPKADSEQGKWVTFCPDKQPSQLCKVNGKTGEFTPLTDNLDFENINSDLSWSPTGSAVLFTANRPGQPGNLYIINDPGAGLRRLTEAPTNDEGTWSPDGDWIAIIPDCRELYLKQPNGQGKNILIPLQDRFCMSMPRWSPDSEAIAFLDLWNFTVDQAPSVWIVRRDGTERRKVFTLPGVFKEVDHIEELAWSPDGTRIGVWFNYGGKRQGVLIARDGERDPLPVAWEAPRWWLPSFWPQWGR